MSMLTSQQKHLRPPIRPDLKRSPSAADRVHPWIRTARISSWWITNDDLYWPDPGVEEEIVRRAAMLAENGVNTVVLFGLHFRWDYVPYFERIRMLIRRIVAECHKHNIRVCDHYSDTLIHRPRNEEDRWFIRKVLNHHVAIYPDYDQDYTFEGSARNSWRQVDSRTGEAAYYDGYRCQMFCPNNPQYQQASLAYARRQFEETGIDGMMNDDLHFLPPDFHSCACGHCRTRFRDDFGRDLPPADEQSFWGNRRNPAFRDWLTLRLRSNGDHYARLRKMLGAERVLFGCCSSMDTQGASDLACVHDEFSRGLNVVSMEMMPRNPIVEWAELFARQSIYQAVAAAGDFLRGDAPSVMDVTLPDPCIGMIYGRTPQQLFMGWALVAAWGARCWACKDTQPVDVPTNGAVKAHDEHAHLARSFKWQAAHEHLYAGVQRVCDVGVVFSTATRNFGTPEEAEAHRRQLIEVTRLMAEDGILSETFLSQTLRDRKSMRKLAARYPLLILPCVAAMSEEEVAGLISYLDIGGRLLVTGTLGKYMEDGAERPSALSERLLNGREFPEKQLRVLPSVAIEQASPGKYEIGKIYHEPLERSAAVQRCLDVLHTLLPSRMLVRTPSTQGWSFNLYRREEALVLHCLNLSGTALTDGCPVPEDSSLRYDVPASGFMECRIRWAGERPGRAWLYSPDGAEGLAVETRRDGDYTCLRIPVNDAYHYGVVVVEAGD